MIYFALSMNRKNTFKKTVRFAGIMIATPVVLFFMLAILLYVPPVQQWVKGIACRSLSEATHTETHIEQVRLYFPLDLNLHGILMKQESDTLLYARTFRLGVRVLPLFRGCLSLDEISLLGARLDTRHLLDDIRLKGKLGWFQVEVPVDYSLVEDTASLGIAHVRNAHLDVLLGDTARQDTSSQGEPSPLKVCLSRADLRNVSVRVVMPGDSMRLGASLCRGILEDVCADVGHNAYTVRQLRLKNSRLDYDVPFAPTLLGCLDINHLHLSRMALAVDSLRYIGGSLDLSLRHLSFRESCGWQMSDARGHVHYDSTLVRISKLALRTPDAHFHCDANVPLSALSEGGHGQMDVNCSGSMGARDLRLLAGKSVESFLPYCQSGPLEVEAHVQGNVDRLRIPSAQLRLGKALNLDIEGEVKHVLSDRRQADLRYQLKAGHPALLSSWLPAGVHIPHSLLLAGRFSMEGSRLHLTSSLSAGHGRMEIQGRMGLENETYDLRLRFRQFPLGIYLPEMPLSPLTADMHLEGMGFDFQSLRTRLSASAHIQQFSYGSWPLDSLQMDARLAGRQLTASIFSGNAWLKAALEAEGAYSPQGFSARLKGNVEDMSIDVLTGNDKDAHLSTELRIVASASSEAHQMEVKGLFEHLHLITPTQGIPADSIGFLFSTSDDHTLAALRSGDFKLRLQSERSWDVILQCVNGFVDAVVQQVKEGQVNQEILKTFMPGVAFTLQSGRRNPVAQLLKIYGYTFDNARMDLKAYPETGLNGQLEVASLRTGNLLLDKTTAIIAQDTSALQLHCAVENTSRKNPNKFKVYLDGSFMDGALSLESRFKDAKGKDGIHFGLKGEMTPQHCFSLHVFPETSVIAYRKFKVNTDNYITISPDLQLEANVDLLADDMTGLKINAERADSVNDITVSLSHVNIEELCSVFPYLPRMSGFLGGDFHVIRQQGSFSASGALEISRFHYGTYDMGDFNTELVFLPEAADSYHLNALVSCDGQSVAEVDGLYTDSLDGRIDAQVMLSRFPCRLLNAFLPQDGSFALDGQASGEVSMTGPVSAMLFDGRLVPDSMMVLSPLYGVSLRVEDKPLEIKESCLKFNHHSMYSTDNKNPLDIHGTVDFRQLDKISINLGVKANDFMIVNSPRTTEGILFGKVYSDMDLKVKGTTQMLLVKGQLHVLGKSDLTYIMKEGPLVVDDWLGGLVEFVDFEDTVRVESEELPSGNIMMTLDMQVDESSKMLVELSADGDSYVRCRGGGHLTMKYLPSGDISLLGTFKMLDGEMKYELPVIPLKTFKFSGDNYVTFTGSPYNPTLHITALETTRASVNDGGSTTRMVTFNVGVAISQTLENMGMKFIIESPEDLTIQNELAAMSEEDRGKMAVSMLVTGMYLSGTNKSSFKANNALNSFLQSEIQNLVGNALKTIDLSVGVEGSTTATGNAQTDYSFQFAKRLWNDRVTFIIGGKVSAGAKEGSTNQSFIDNISLEYRIDRNATRYVRLFYDNDSQDPLEGTYSSAGAGFVWRNKSSRFGDLFLRPRRKSVDYPSVKE